MPIQRRKILVSTALPYANGQIHIGHMLEHIQANIWTRFMRMVGHEIYHVCADDAHGTPIMLRAEDEGVKPEQLLAKMQAAHQQDFVGFGVNYDNYGSTHSDHNRQLSESIYLKLKEAGLIVKREIVQMHDAKKGMYLPDRYVKGDCPCCQAADQNGDSCEKCGAAYDPIELGNPKSVITGTTPELKKSEHYFFALSQMREFLHQWINEKNPGPGIGPRLSKPLLNKLNEWTEGELKDWDISRDEPYFGFKIPGTKDKYFYVWLDAPVGYLASFLQLCEREGLDFDEFMKPDSTTELYHFIGKDILYFHGLFWPAMLHTAGMRTPTRLFIHGFLSINGEKMSKSKGTFISANSYLKLKLNPEWLRYYFASKLRDHSEDIDLNLEDFTNQVNSDLVGKLANIPSRVANFLQRNFDGKLSNAPAMIKPDYAEFAHLYEGRNFAQAVRNIMGMTEAVNRQLEKAKPWNLAKDPNASEQLRDVCSAALQSFRILAGLLKPIVPELVGNVEKFLQIEELTWDNLATPMPVNHQVGKFKHLIQRIEPANLEMLLAANRDNENETQPTTGKQIDINTFAELDLRIVKVLSAEIVADSSKLLKLSVDIGELGIKTVFAGLQGYIDPEQMIGQSVVVVANLQPRKMRFGTSEAMVLTAGADGDGNQLNLLTVDGDSPPGAKIS